MTLRRRLALTIFLTAVPLVAGVLWLRADLRHRSRVRSLREFALITMQSGGRRICEMFPAAFPNGTAFAGFGLGAPTAEDLEAAGLPMPPGPRGPGPVGPPPDPLGLGPRGDDPRGPGRPPPPREGPPREGPPEGPDRRGPPPPRPPPLPEDRQVALWAYHADLHSSNPNAPPLSAAVREALEDGERTASESFEKDGREALRVVARMPWSEGPCAVVLVEGVLPPEADEERATLYGLVALGAVVLLAVLVAAGPIVRRIRRLQEDVKRSAATRYESPVAAEGSDEVSDLARVFNEAGSQVRTHLAAVEDRERTLRAFVANTTHDVMIPLTVLQGHLAEQRKRLARGEPVDEDALGAGLEESHYIGSLLHNLAAVAKLETGSRELEREPVDLNALVERVVERHRPVARERDVELEYGVPDDAVVAQGDVTLLEQAVRNVVHNAIRYHDGVAHDRGGHVSIVLEREDGTFSLRVLDDGPGVDDALLERLAERRFRSLAARTRDPDGSGLGLHIARDVARRHGFELTFENLTPHGLAVTLRGPVAEDAPDA